MPVGTGDELEVLTTVEDVEAALLRPLSTFESSKMDAIILRASTRLISRMPSLQSRMAAWSTVPRPGTAINPDTVAAVLGDIIARALANPKRLWSASETTGPFSHSETYAGARGGNAASIAPGGIVITDDDLAQLTGASAATRLPRTARLHAGMAPGNVELS